MNLVSRDSPFIWERGVRICGSPEVYNNFPLNTVFKHNKLKIGAQTPLIKYSYQMQKKKKNHS